LVLFLPHFSQVCFGTSNFSDFGLLLKKLAKRPLDLVLESLDVSCLYKKKVNINKNVYDCNPLKKSEPNRKKIDINNELTNQINIDTVKIVTPIKVLIPFVFSKNFFIILIY